LYKGSAVILRRFKNKYLIPQHPKMKKHSLSKIAIVAFAAFSFLHTTLLAQDSTRILVKKTVKSAEGLPCPYCLDYTYYVGTQETTCHANCVDESPASSVACGAGICVGTSVSFSSNYCNSPIAGLNIYNSSGTLISTSATANYTFNTVGSFSANLIDNMGNPISGLGVNISIVPLPTANFTVSPSTTVCEGEPVTLTLVGTAPTSFGWGGIQECLQGVGATGQGTSPYVLSCGLPVGTNTISLVESNNGNVSNFVPDQGCGLPSGCLNTVTQTITVNQIQPAFTYTTTCGSNVITLTNTTINPGLTNSNFTWQWKLNGTVFSTSANPGSYTVPTTGAYTITLDVTSVSGCASSAIDGTTASHVIDVGVAVATSASGTCSIATSGTVTATATGGVGPYTYSWLPGGATTNSMSNLAGGSYTVTVTAANGCKGTAVATVPVDSPPAITVTPASASICLGSSVVFTATGSTSYKWSPSTGLSATTGATVTAKPTVTTNYLITSAVDQWGCPSQKTVTVNVSPVPTVSVTTASSLMCAGGSVPLDATGTNSTNYVWTPATGLSCSTCYNPVAKPTATTVYTVTAYSGNMACAATATTTVHVGPPVAPVITAQVTRYFCPSNPVTLSASAATATSYSWRIYPASTNFSLSSTGPGSSVDLMTKVYSQNVTVEVDATNACGTSPYAAYTVGAGSSSECLLKSPETMDAASEVTTTDIKVYPNPANSILNIQTQLAAGQTENMCIYNNLGQQMHCLELTDNNTTISIDNLPAGIYFYRITDMSGNLIKNDKLMIVH